MSAQVKIAFCIAILFSIAGYANDGVYYVSGNHLVPMYESDITVKKVFLNLRNCKAISRNKNGM
jgi:hypothetical protein